MSRIRKARIFLLTLILSSLIISNIIISIPHVQAEETNYEWQIEHDKDDCLLYNGVYNDNSDLIYWFNTAQTRANGFRWLNINITQGSIIESAYMKWCAIGSAEATDPTVVIRGEDADDAIRFVSAEDFNGRDRTDASVEYDVPATSYHVWYETNDLKTIIQEIVDREGWESENALVLFMDLEPPGDVESGFRAHDYSSGQYSAFLNITWIPFIPPPPPYKPKTYSVVIDESGAGSAELSVLGYEDYSRTFYSNYSRKFYSLYDYLGIGWENSEIHYSFSLDASSWTEHEMFLGNESGLYLSSPAIYLHPDGRFIDYCYESRSDSCDLWWGRKEILKNGTIISNISSTMIIDDLIDGWGTGASRIWDKYSIVVDNAGYIYISFVWGTSSTESLRGIKSLFNNGTWNLEEFEHKWLIESEWIDNGGDNPSNINWGGTLFPMKGEEDIGLVFYSDDLGGVQEIHRSMYYDNSTDDWINMDGELFNDNEGGDWATGIWTVGYSDDIAVFFKQNEKLHTPDRIRLDAKFLNMDNYTWMNQTAISFEVLGDAGSTVFMPLVSVNEELGSINFIWSIIGNDTIWYRRMYPNHTLEDIGILESNLYNELIHNQFSSHPRSFSPMGVEWLVNDSSIYEAEYEGDFVLHNYVPFLLDDWFAFGCLNTTLYNSDGSINDGWIFRGETYKFVSYFLRGSLFHLNFTDGEHEIIFTYNNATQRLSILTEDQFIVGDYFFNITQYTGGITKAEWGFIPNTNIVDIEDTITYCYIYNDELSEELTGSTGITFNIYNLGGFTYYSFNGDGGKTPYGTSAFDLYATNGTENSWARAEQIFRKLQHISFLIEIDMDNEWDDGNGEFDIDAGVGYVDIGFDYRLNSSWVEGFKTRLYVQSADVGHHNGGVDHDWVEWSVDFYNYDPSTGYQQSLTSQLILSNHWGYEHENYVPDYYNRTSSQLWIDLWFDKTNASTTIACQVNAYYHGLKEQGSSWWFGYGEFIPMISDYDNAKFLDDLYDETGNITNCQKFDLIKFFIKVGKVSSEDGDDETWRIRAIEDMHREIAIDRMEGIDEPTFVQTKVLDMPQTGFINALKSAIGGIANSITQGIFFMLKSLWAGVGWVAELMGLKDWYDSLSLMLGNIATASLNFMNELEIALINSALLLEQIFRLVSSGLTRYTYGIYNFVTGMLAWYNGIIDMFSGGGIFSANIWASLNLEDWFILGIHLLPVWWIDRLAKADDLLRTAQGDISFVILLVTGLFNFLTTVIMLSISLLNFLIGLLPI